MDKFIKKVKMQMLTDIISLICFVLCIITIGIVLVLLVTKQYYFIFFCLIAFIIFGGLIYCFRKKYNCGIENRYEFTLDNVLSFEDIKTRLEECSEKYYSNNDCCVYSFYEKSREYRILLFRTDDFNRKKYYSARKSANKAFNKKYSVDSKKQY